MRFRKKTFSTNAARWFESMHRKCNPSYKRGSPSSNKTLLWCLQLSRTPGSYHFATSASHVSPAATFSGDTFNTLGVFMRLETQWKRQEYLPTVHDWGNSRPTVHTHCLYCWSYDCFARVGYFKKRVIRMVWLMPRQTPLKLPRDLTRSRTSSLQSIIFTNDLIYPLITGVLTTT